MEFKSSEAIPYAIKLGVALQLESPDARALYGMNLYPRFLWKNYGLDRNVYLEQPYSRLAFTVLGASGTRNMATLATLMRY